MASLRKKAETSKSRAVSASKGRGVKESANEIDSLVGARVRTRRTLMGLSQERLAEQSGVTFQQVQKYETGKNRISASRLVQFAKILDVPISFFFETIEMVGVTLTKSGGFAENQQDQYFAGDIMTSKETLELIRTYYSIQDPKLRRNLMKVLKQMAQSQSSEINN